jgi:hypothetical protein
VEIINCFEDDDDVIIEENGDKDGEQLVMECEEEELTPEQQRAYEMAQAVILKVLGHGNVDVHQTYKGCDRDFLS